MALTGLGVGLWRSHLLEDASGLALLLFSSITLLTVGSAVLAVWASRPYSDSQAKNKTEQSEPFSKPFGSVRVSKSKTRKAATKVAALAIMVGLGLLAILPIVALVKVSIVESRIDKAVTLGASKSVLSQLQTEFNEALNEHR
jgi:hypothetical protein